MRCDYCGNWIEPEKEEEQIASATIDGLKKTKYGIGLKRIEYHCCSYECRVSMAEKMAKTLSAKELEKEMTQKKKPSKITVSDVALVVSILGLLFQFFCHVILPKVI